MHPGREVFVFVRKNIAFFGARPQTEAPAKAGVMRRISTRWVSSRREGAREKKQHEGKRTSEETKRNMKKKKRAERKGTQCPARTHQLLKRHGLSENGVGELGIELDGAVAVGDGLLVCQDHHVRGRPVPVEGRHRHSIKWLRGPL